LGLYRAYFVVPAAFFMIVATIASSPWRVGMILLGFGVGGAVAAVLNAAIVLDALRHHVLDLSTTPPVAIYQTANAVSLYLVPLVAMAASLVLYGKGRAVRWLSALFLMLALPACLLSFSRGGYLALGAVGLGLAISHRWARLLVPAVIAAGLAISQVPLIRARIRRRPLLQERPESGVLGAPRHAVGGSPLEWSDKPSGGNRVIRPWRRLRPRLATTRAWSATVRRPCSPAPSASRWWAAGWCWRRASSSTTLATRIRRPPSSSSTPSCSPGAWSIWWCPSSWCVAFGRAAGSAFSPPASISWWRPASSIFRADTALRPIFPFSSTC